MKKSLLILAGLLLLLAGCGKKADTSVPTHRSEGMS